uniref:Chromo domain-containing protein n=1 Tax=Graphocephala atropunctata TaxID=36148 RepID=A0A1B6M3C4_9HEMI
MVKSKKIVKKDKVVDEVMEVNPKSEDSTETQVEDEGSQNEDVSAKKKGKAKKEEAVSQEDTEDGEDSETKENGEVVPDKKKPAAEKKAKATKRAAAKPAVEPARKSSRTPKPVAKENGEEESYEVDEVVGVRMKNGKKEFKIRWKGYKANEDTWEPEAHLSCQDLIKAYIEDHKAEVEIATKKTPSKKSKTPTKAAKGKKAKRK